MDDYTKILMDEKTSQCWFTRMNFASVLIRGVTFGVTSQKINLSWIPQMIYDMLVSDKFGA